MTRQPILATAFALLGGLLACTQQDYSVSASPDSDPMIAAKAAPASAGKVALCHITGKAGYNLIEVSANAQAAHLAHGDKVAPVGATSATACSTPNLPPEITNTVPDYNIQTDVMVQFGLGILTDPDGNGPWTVSVDWGDFGPPELITVTSLNEYLTWGHSYVQKGFYQIPVVATDAAGASSSPAYINVSVSARETVGEEHTDDEDGENVEE